MSSKRLLWKFFFTFLVIILFSLSATVYFSSTILRYNYINEKKSDLNERAYLILDQVASHLETNKTSNLDSICQNIGRKSNTRITVIKIDGIILADSDEDPKLMDNHSDRPEFKEALTNNFGSSIRYSYTLNKEFLYVAIPVKFRGQIQAVLRISVPLTFIEQSVADIQKNMIIIALVIALIVALISLIISRQISRPLDDMQKGVEHFAAGEFNFRLAIPKSVEMAKLAGALNHMAEQVDGKIKTVIEQRNEQLAVLESMVEGVLALDQDERIININKAGARILNLDAKSVLGSSIQEIVRNTELQVLIEKTIRESAPVEGEIILRNKVDHFLQVHGTVLNNASGDLMGAVIVLNDVTRLRRLENVRRDFVANVSHEIKTPLTSIKGFAETLLDGGLDDQNNARKFIDIIAKQSNRLNAIIEDLLILAQLEQEGERAQIDFIDTVIFEVVDAAIQICLPKSKEKNISVKIDCPKKLEFKINPDLLEQALVNLIDNAIKYSDRGSSINVRVEERTDDIMINVTDYGVGIEKKHLPRLFERFYRVDKARSRDLGGTGLGLSIVKHIAQVHRGRVQVESTPGKGSSFRIYLPR